MIVSDARFRKDSYYIESTGVAGPFLVDWVKTNLAYLKAAKKIEGTLKRAEEKKVEVLSYRCSIVLLYKKCVMLCSPFGYASLCKPSKRN